MSIRKLEGTHKFSGFMVCDRCGFKVSYDLTGRPVMRDHLAAKHQLGETAPKVTSAPGYPKLFYGRLDDRTYSIDVQVRPRSSRRSIGTVYRQGSLPSCTRWYGRGNWSGAETTLGWHSRGDAGALVWRQWQDRQQPEAPGA